MLSEITVVSLFHSEALGENLNSSDSSYKIAYSSPAWQDPRKGLRVISLSAWVVPGTSGEQGGTRERCFPWHFSGLWMVTYTIPLVTSSLGVQLILRDPEGVFEERARYPKYYVLASPVTA